MPRMIRVKRNRGLTGAAVAYDICIDGVPKESIRNGEEKEIVIDCREHFVNIMLRGKTMASVRLPEGTNGAGFEVKHKMTLLGTDILLNQISVIPGTPDA